jgi:hypothetical protein
MVLVVQEDKTLEVAEVAWQLVWVSVALVVPVLLSLHILPK